MSPFRLSTLLVSALISALASEPVNAGEASKYGPTATRLSLAREYIKSNEAPDFWALMPYYTAQENNKACSVASIAMMLNGFRSDRTLKASDELVTQKTVTSRHSFLKSAIGPGGRGVELDRLGKSVSELLKTWDPVETYEVEVVHVNASSPDSIAQLKQALVENEKSSKDFILANFLQGTLTGDPEGNVGHISPIGAYDAKKDQVLILDSDRQYYEPYWVSFETLLKGMSTLDGSAKKTRGFVWVKRAVKK